MRLEVSVLSVIIIFKTVLYSTGGPRYMRTFYLRIRVYAICKSRQNSLYAIVFIPLLRLYAIFN